MKKHSMARTLVASALITLSLAATSFAAKGDKEVDVSIGFATSSNSGFDAGFGSGFGADFGTGFGLSAGGGYELLDITAIKGSTLQVRGDIGYNHWSEAGSTLTRVPLSAGARLYIPIQAVKKLRVYGEAGLELSFDNTEVEIPVFNFFGITSGAKFSDSSTNIGLDLAGGAEYTVAPNIAVIGSLKYHVVDGGYLNALVGAGFKF